MIDIFKYSPDRIKGEHEVYIQPMDRDIFRCNMPDLEKAPSQLHETCLPKIVYLKIL